VIWWVPRKALHPREGKLIGKRIPRSIVTGPAHWRVTTQVQNPKARYQPPAEKIRNTIRDQSIQIQGWEKMREPILERDNWACRICGNDGDGSSLHVHHIDWDRRHNQDENLVTLCHRCHSAVHREGYKPENHPDWPAPWGNNNTLTD
jgi:5-methylcytosine-specific restriction endonuclease McrA